MAQSKPGSGYKPKEDVNQGPAGAPGGKVGSPGQNSDGGQKDSLVPMTPMQFDPYRSKGSDFPVNAVTAATGQSGAHGSSSGGDSLAAQSENQCGPRFLEDDGPGPKGSGTPTNWQGGGRSGKIASAFPIKQNTGESDVSKGGQTSIAESVNLQTGLIEAKGYSATRIKETEEQKVSIPAGRS